MIKSIHHVGIAVQNLAASTTFYENAARLREVMGFPAMCPVPLPNVAQSIMLAGQNAQLRLMQMATFTPTSATRRPVSNAGITHFCLQAPDVLALHANFAAAGASFHSNPVDLGTGFLYCYSRDLEDNVVELEGVPNLWPDPRPWFAHVSFSTSNLNRLADFYTAILGGPAVRSGAIGPHARIDQVAGLDKVELKAVWVGGAGIQIEIMQYLNPATGALAPNGNPCDVPGYAYLCFEVADTAAALEQMIALGATQSSEQIALGHTSDGCAAWFCADPDGNLICLLSLDGSASQFSTAALSAPDVVARMNKLRAQPAA